MFSALAYLKSRNLGQVLRVLSVIVTLLFFTVPCRSEHLYMNQEISNPMLCLFMCVHVWQLCMCRGVRGQSRGLGSFFLPCAFWDPTQVIRLGCWLLYYCAILPSPFHAFPCISFWWSLAHCHCWLSPTSGRSSGRIIHYAYRLVFCLASKIWWGDYRDKEC